jgi:glycosyltransferase involved in cell wall biosynthesis
MGGVAAGVAIMTQAAALDIETASAKPRPVATISLVVCTLGRQRQLRRLLESLALQAFVDFLVIVVDKNQPGFIDDILDDFRSALRIVHVRTSPGLSAARNSGLARAGGAVIAFPDDDCWYRPDTLSDAIKRMEDEPALMVLGGRTMDRNGYPSVSVSVDVPARVTRGNYLNCSNSNGLFFRRDVFSTIGNFDVRLGVGATTGFHSSEESDVVLRALDAGLVAHYFPDLVIHHDQVDATIAAGEIRRARGYGQGFGALLRKHRFSIHYVLYRVARPRLAAALHLVRGKPAVARYKLVWACAIAEGYQRWPAGAAAPRPTERLFTVR